MRLRRAAIRLLPATMLVVTGVLPASAASPPTVIDPKAEAPVIEQLAAHAKALAEQAYQTSDANIPSALADLQYDAYKDIRYRSDKALWHGNALFEVQLFHPGFLYREPVQVNVIADGSVESIPFDNARFEYGEKAQGVSDINPEGLGYAGFRVHYPINTNDYKDEVAAFLGASYFRLIGRHQQYGLSARGLAVNTATSQGEEFPKFTRFWLSRPGPEATTLTIYALLDSPSITGAYRFDLRPGQPTSVQVDARLYTRSAITKLGVAPVTSMYFRGENSLRHYDDFRPEIHDSDGLLMHDRSGEWIWRPLTNPQKLRVTALQDERPLGFGLIQRDRLFSSYLDLGTRYDKRPDYWVTPTGGDWASGAVELIEIPTDSETNDNITAYWKPEHSPEAGDSLTYQYRVETSERGVEHGLGKAIRTRIGAAAVPGDPDPLPKAQRRFIIDFQGEDLNGLDASQPVMLNVETSSGKLADKTAQPLPDGGWRAAFRLIPEGSTPADMRASLSLRGSAITETWTYVWYPEDLR